MLRHVAIDLSVTHRGPNEDAISAFKVACQTIILENKCLLSISISNVLFIIKPTYILLSFAQNSDTSFKTTPVVSDSLSKIETQVIEGHLQNILRCKEPQRMMYIF